MITKFTTVEQENRNAKQEMNNMYLKMVGDAERLKVLKFLYNHVWLFRIGSVLASMFGFYYDLVLGLGVLGAIAISMLIAYIIEAIKVYGTKASFSYEGWIRYGAIIATLSVMYSAYLFHYKSLTNYKNILDKKDSSMVYTHKVNQDNAFNKVNLELVGVLKNKISSDDAIASSSIQSTNKLLANNGNDYATKAFLDASTITNTGLATTLFLIFIFLETCSLFGVVAGMMLMGSTDKNVKSIVNTQDKLNQMETNVYQAVETQMIGNSMNRIEDNLKQVSSHPTPSQNSYNQPSNPQLPFYNASASSGYFMGVLGDISPKHTKPLNIAPLPSSDSYSLGALHQNYQEKVKNTEHSDKRVADLLKYNHKEQQIMQIMWENGEVKKGDKLVSKRLVKKDLKEERLITHKEIDNLYAKLEEQGHIIFKNGYRAVTEIENIITKKVG